MKIVIVIMMLIVSASLAYAQGDLVAGKEKVVVCASCHNEDGNSAMGAWPKLAGQNQKYLVAQMLAFQQGENGVRYDMTMTPLMAGLSRQDIEDIAAYYASQTPIIGAADPDLVARGQQLYRGGDMDKNISACSACHGPQGEGNSEAGFPRLGGQHPEYIIAELLAYKNGQRKSDHNEIMRDISKRMDESDMHAVASYIYGLY